MWNAISRMHPSVWQHLTVWRTAKLVLRQTLVSKTTSLIISAGINVTVSQRPNHAKMNMHKTFQYQKRLKQILYILERNNPGVSVSWFYGRGLEPRNVFEAVLLKGSSKKRFVCCEARAGTGRLCALHCCEAFICNTSSTI